jgi:hypothetical protein
MPDMGRVEGAAMAGVLIHAEVPILSVFQEKYTV